MNDIIELPTTNSFVKNNYHHKSTSILNQASNSIPQNESLHKAYSKNFGSSADENAFDVDSLAHALGGGSEVDELGLEYNDESDDSGDESSHTSTDEAETAQLSPKRPYTAGAIKSGRPTVQPVNHAYTQPIPHPLIKQSSGGKNFPRFKKPLSAIPEHLRVEGFARAKHNSTSSLFINSTLSKPDTDEVLRCMAQAVLYHIQKSYSSSHKTSFDIFSEEKFPITKTKVDTTHVPESEEIYHFISTIFRAERLDPECAIMCLAYIERIISLTGLSMDSNNWRRVVLSALILASKVWEDQSVWNVDFLPVFDNLTAADLNKLERQFLALLQYNVSLNASLYAKYYFELRTFSKLDPQNFPLQPLDKLAAKRLETHSQASEHRVRTFKRSASVDTLTPIEQHHQHIIS